MIRSTQVGAVPIRRRTTGEIEVLLVTSRETRRWVIPKGWPWPGVSDPEAAAAEAWEEAGVRGNVVVKQMGTFTYNKRRDGDILTVDVVVYLLEVTEEEPAWPEMDERQRAWFTPAAAAQVVAEQELRALLHTLDV